MKKITVNFTLNGQPVSVETTPHRRLLDLLREECAVGECGACTVILDGKAVTSCLVLAASVEGSSVVTIEGVGENGRLDPIQEAILRNHALQCGFCTPGFIMSAKALLEENPDATVEEIRRAISGNLCRCTGYEQLTVAIYEAAQELKAAGKGIG